MQTLSKPSVIDRARKLVSRYERALANYHKIWGANNRAQAIEALIPRTAEERKRRTDAIEEVWRPHTFRASEFLDTATEAMIKFLVKQTGVRVPESSDEGQYFAPAAMLIDGRLWMAVFTEEVQEVFVHCLDVDALPSLSAEDREPIAIPPHREESHWEQWGRRYWQECNAMDEALVDARDAIEPRLPFMVFEREREMFSDCNPDETRESILAQIDPAPSSGWDQTLWQGDRLLAVILKGGPEPLVYRFDPDTGALLPGQPTAPPEPEDTDGGATS